MHIAVDKGTEEGKDFTYYIDFLQKEGYITDTMRIWIDSIRTNGNDSTHKLKKPEKDHCTTSLWFTTQLLRIVYEMEKMSSLYVKKPEKNYPKNGS